MSISVELFKFFKKNDYNHICTPFLNFNHAWWNCPYCITYVHRFWTLIISIELVPKRCNLRALEHPTSKSNFIFSRALRFGVGWAFVYRAPSHALFESIKCRRISNWLLWSTSRRLNCRRKTNIFVEKMIVCFNFRRQRKLNSAIIIHLLPVSNGIKLMHVFLDVPPWVVYRRYLVHIR